MHGRSGVVWNKFALHLDSWQIFLEVNVHNVNILGGDGFALWLLNENDIKRPPQTANKFSAKNVLLGDLYGIRRDFNGTGIIFDTYDNDNNGDNPLVFIINNDGKQDIKMDVEMDFESHRRNTNENKHLPIPPSECTLDYHNRESVKLLIRYQNGFIHIYSDLEHKSKLGKGISDIISNVRNAKGFPFANGGILNALDFGFGGIFRNLFENDGSLEKHHTPHFCLAKEIDLRSSQNSRNKYHIVLSANTGEIADNHDIRILETKYLHNSKKYAINDQELFPVGKRLRNQSSWILVFWIIICVLSLMLFLENVSEIILFNKLYYKQMPISQCISQINDGILISYCLSAIQYSLLICFFHWKTIFISAPLVIIRIYKYMTNNILLDVKTFEMSNYWFGLRYGKWVWCQLLMIAMAGMYHVWRAFHI